MLDILLTPHLRTRNLLFWEYTMFNDRLKKERQKVLNLPISMKSWTEKFKIIGKSKYKWLWIFWFWISSFLHEKKVVEGISEFFKFLLGQFEYIYNLVTAYFEICIYSYFGYNGLTICHYYGRNIMLHTPKKNLWQKTDFFE